MLYFVLIGGFLLDGTEGKYALYIYILLMICFALNIYFLANSKEDLKKWGYIKSKKINIKEVLLIMGNIGLFVIFVRFFDISNLTTTILSISLIGVPLLNIFYIFYLFNF